MCRTERDGHRAGPEKILKHQISLGNMFIRTQTWGSSGRLSLVKSLAVDDLLDFDPSPQSKHCVATGTWTKGPAAAGSLSRKRLAREPPRPKTGRASFFSVNCELYLYAGHLLSRCIFFQIHPSPTTTTKLANPTLLPPIKPTHHGSKKYFFC